jgi:hypothetical protein
MTRLRTLIFLGLTAALLMVAASRVLATSYYIFRNPDGSLKRVAGQPEEWQKWGDQEYDCRTGTCNFCGQCHQKAAALTGKRFISGVHATAYAKIAVRLTPGQRITWGPDAFLRLDQDRICMFSNRNEKLICYDPASILMKDKAGQPTFISWSRPPTLYGLKPSR